MCDTKKCSKCGELKGLGEFYKAANQKSGLTSSCKSCALAWHKGDRKSNPEKYREREAKKYLLNRNSIKEKSKAWKLANPEKFKAQMTDWASRNKDKCKAIDSKYEKYQAQTISDVYIKARLSLGKAEVPSELIALKREQLAIHRMARELKKAATESTNPTGENQ